MAHRSSVRIDMTPMVDVAFLLLIFFMSTTSFKPPERIAVRLPLSRSEIRVPETGTIILTVNREGQFFISSANMADMQEVAKEDLLAAIVAWRTQNPAAVVILRGDRDAAFGEVADLMDAMAEAKTLRFNLMTDLRRTLRPVGAQPGAAAGDESVPGGLPGTGTRTDDEPGAGSGAGEG